MATTSPDHHFDKTTIDGGDSSEFFQDLMRSIRSPPYGEHFTELLQLFLWETTSVLQCNQCSYEYNFKLRAIVYGFVDLIRATSLQELVDSNQAFTMGSSCPDCDSLDFSTLSVASPKMLFLTTLHPIPYKIVPLQVTILGNTYQLMYIGYNITEEEPKHRVAAICKEDTWYLMDNSTVITLGTEEEMSKQLLDKNMYFAIGVKQ